MPSSIHMFLSDLPAGSISLKGHGGSSCFNTRLVVIKETPTGFHAIPGGKVTWLFCAIQMNRAAGRKELTEPEHIGDDFP